MTAAAPPTVPRPDELVVIGEIARAFLTTARAEDVFDLALARTAPLVGAAFASVFRLEPGGTHLRPAAAWNWPARFAPWLDSLRVPVGSGPTGLAARDRRGVDIADVYADPALADWQEVAQELGFRALIAEPLAVGDRVLGALTLYFAEAGALPPPRRALVRLVADQIAATAQKALLIDELQAANAQLERQVADVLEARRVKDEFLANVGHELRTPVAAMLGSLELLDDGALGDPSDVQRAEFAAMREAGERLLALVDDLLELTRARDGSVALRPTTFDVRAPVEAAVAAARPKPGVSVTTALPPAGTTMTSDPRKVGRVLQALVANACKFTEDGAVSIVAVVEPEWVRYEVHDTGIGIPPEALARVFDDFAQADGSATRAYGGAGIGLALARRLVRQLGGELSVRSSPGTGSIFVAELPRHPGVAADWPAPAAPPVS